MSRAGPGIYARDHPGVLPGVYVRLTVRETGVGMAPETLSYLFEFFYTTKASGNWCRGSGNPSRGGAHTALLATSNPST